MKKVINKSGYKYSIFTNKININSLIGVYEFSNGEIGINETKIGIDQLMKMLKWLENEEIMTKGEIRQFLIKVNVYHDYLSLIEVYELGYEAYMKIEKDRISPIYMYDKINGSCEVYKKKLKELEKVRKKMQGVRYDLEGDK